MPLIQSKSKKAMSKNIEAEMDAGKPQKQSIAIAYSIKRKNQRKKMAKGGKIEHSARAEDDNAPAMPAKKPDDRRLNKDDYMSEQWAGGPDPQRKPDDKRLNQAEYMSGEMGGQYADGGEVTSKPNSPRPSQASIESKDLNSKAGRGELSPAQKAEYHEQEAAKYRMMAEGGLVGDGSRAQEDNNPGVPGRKPDDSRLPMKQYMSDQFDDGDSFPKGRSKNQRPSAEEMASDYFADGGMVGIMKENYGSKPKSLAEAIMRKRKMMADGGQVHSDDDGQVDLEHLSEEEPNQYYGHNQDTANRPQYDDSQISEQPWDSNEDGDDREDSRSDKHDMISQIRKKIKYKNSLG